MTTIPASLVVAYGPLSMGESAGHTVAELELVEHDAVDVEWLDAALRGSGALDDAELVGFDAEPVGTGQVGHNIRYTLRYDHPPPDAPATVIGKFPSPDPTSRSTGVAIGTYLKEGRFYRELASGLDVRAPRCFGVALDETAGLSVLVLEDLAPADQGDQISGCPPEGAAAAIAEAAALHAPRWGDPRLLDHAWLSAPSQEGTDGIQQIYQAVWPGFVERYAHRLDDDVLTLGVRFGVGLPGWAARRREGPLTVVHGDFRLDNLLFRPGGHRVGVVDWQTVALGIGTDDVSYLLGAGLLPGDLRDHEVELVRGYHEDLVRRGVPDYPWERCWDDYVRFSLSGLQMAVVASMIVRQDDRGDEMFCVMAERHAEQALRLGADRFLG